MNNKISVFMALAAGLLGGLLTRYIAPATVFAQNQTSATTEIRAQSFVLVDAQNHAVGTFFSEPLSPPSVRPVYPGQPGPSRIVLRDFNGREIWSASSNPMRQLSQR
jgi:hypothetical protein